MIFYKYLGLIIYFFIKSKYTFSQKKVKWSGRFHKNLVMSKICNPKIKRGLLLKISSVVR